MALERNQGFYFHSVPQDSIVVSLMKDLRKQYIQLAISVEDLCENNRERSLALTYLEDSLMRAIQSLALAHGKKEDM